MDTIKAVLFDVDGVLLDSFEANLKFYQDLMVKAGYKSITREDFSELFHLTMRDVVKIITKSDSDEEIDRVWQMGRNREVNYPVELLAMPENADETLKVLSEKYLLGIVTSRVRESVYESPKLAKLKRFFKITVSYQDTTNHKPDPEPLLFAAEKLGVKSSDCVYIGDVANDVSAARAADMRVIIYSKDHFHEADLCTSSFGNIPELIKTL